jgi:hypothetical protein
VVEEAVNADEFEAAMTVERAKALPKEAAKATISQGNVEQNELDQLERKSRPELNEKLDK